MILRWLVRTAESLAPKEKSEGKRQDKDTVLFISSSEHKEDLAAGSEWMRALEKIPPKTGPRFPDGSINWQCPCMAGGSLVAHRCGHLFRRLYVCMQGEGGEEGEKTDATTKCPGEFIDWAACMQNMSAERRERMRQSLLAENEKEKKEEK